MAELLINGEVADRLRDLARREERSVESVLETMIERYGERELIPTLADLARVLEAADFHSVRSDTAAHSREIIETEYADYLTRRGRGDASR